MSGERTSKQHAEVLKLGEKIFRALAAAFRALADHAKEQSK